MELAEKAVVVSRGQPGNVATKGGPKRRHSSLFRQISTICESGGHSRAYADLDVSDLVNLQDIQEAPLELPKGFKEPQSPIRELASTWSPQQEQQRAVSQQERANSKASDHRGSPFFHSAMGRMQDTGSGPAAVMKLFSRKKLFLSKKPMGSEVYAQDEMSDVEAIDWLTRAPAGCPTRQDVRKEREKVKTWMSSPKNKRSPRSWAAAPQLFQEAVPGSDYRPSSRCCSSSSQVGSPRSAKDKGKCLVKMNTKEIKVIDEDPVVALFEAERLAKAKTRRGAVASAVSAVGRLTSKRGSQGAERWAKVKMMMIDKKKEEKKAAAAEKGEPEKILPKSWEVLLTAVAPPKEDKRTALTNAKRNACEVVRRFWWGAVGNEHARTAQEANEALYVTKATPEQVDRTWRMWKRLDIMKTGQVDSTAFLRVGHLSKGGDSRPAERAVRVLLEKKTHCTLDEVIRVLWPCAGLSDLEAVQRQLDELREGTREAETPAPPILAPAELEGLIGNFHHIRKEGLGDSRTRNAEVLSLDQIVHAGLLSADDGEKYFKRYGKTPSDLINCTEFCEMFCPDGFRATSNSCTATDEDGNRLASTNGVWKSVSESTMS